MPKAKKDENGVYSLSDVDDEEIDKMILTEEESKLKKIIWDSLNKDWIREQKQKRRDKKLIKKTQALKKKRSLKVSMIKSEPKDAAEAIRNSSVFNRFNPISKSL